MPSFTVREKEGNLQKAIRGAYVIIPTKPRSKRKWKKMKSIIILKRTEKNYKVKLLNPEALSQKIWSLKYSRDYSFLFSEPVVRVSPAPPPIPLLKDVSATAQGSRTKWFKTSAPEITIGNKGTVKSCAATIRGDEGYSCLNNKQRRRHFYQDYRGNRRSSVEATEEDVRALRWIKEIERRESWTKACNPKWERMGSAK